MGSLAGCGGRGVERSPDGGGPDGGGPDADGDVGPAHCQVVVDAAGMPQPEGMADGGGACYPAGPGPHPAIASVFAANLRVTPPPGAVHESSPSLAVDPRVESRRVAVAAMVDGTTDCARIMVAFSADDGTTFPPDLVTVFSGAPGTRLSSPTVTFDRGGRLFLAYVVFAGAVESTAAVVVRWTDDGTTFTPPKPLFFGPKKWTDVTITAGFGTLAIVVGNLAVFRSTDRGGTWDADPVWVGTHEATHPIARFDPTDRLHLLWVRHWDNAFKPVTDVAFATLPPSGPPTAEVQVSRDGEPVIDQPVALGITTGTTIYAAWSAGDPATGAWDVHATQSLDGGKGWEDPVTVNEDSTCATHFLLDGVVDAYSGFHIVWLDNQRGPGMAVAGLFSKIGLLAPNRALSDRFFPFASTRPGSDSPGTRLTAAMKGDDLYAAWADARPVAGEPESRAHVWFTRGAAAVPPMPKP